MSVHNTLTVDEFVELFPNQQTTIPLYNDEVFKLFSPHIYKLTNTKFIISINSFETIEKICSSGEFANYMKILDSPNVQLKILLYVENYFSNLGPKYLQNYIELYMCVLSESDPSINYVLQYFIKQNSPIYIAELFNNARFIKYYNIKYPHEIDHKLGFGTITFLDSTINEIYEQYFRCYPVLQMPRDIADRYISAEMARSAAADIALVNAEFEELHIKYVAMMANKSRDCTNDAKKITELFGILMREEQK